MPRKKNNGQPSEALPSLMMLAKNHPGWRPSWDEVSRARKETEGDFSLEARHRRWITVGSHYRNELPNLDGQDRQVLMTSSIRLALECMQSPRSLESMRQAVRQVGFTLQECRGVNRRRLDQLDFCLALSDRKTGYQFWLRDRPRDSHPASSEEEIVAAIEKLLERSQGWVTPSDMQSKLEEDGIVFPKTPDHFAFLRWSRSLQQAIGRRDGTLCNISHAGLEKSARIALSEAALPISAKRLWMVVRGKENLATHPCHDLHVRYWLDRMPDLVIGPKGGYTLAGKNTQSLKTLAMSVLMTAGKPLRASEVWERVQELGYVTTARDPIQNVASALVALPRAQSTPDGYIASSKRTNAD